MAGTYFLPPDGGTIATDPGLAIRGTVVDPEGKPVEGVVVTSVQSPRGPTAVTDGKGRFRLDGVEPEGEVWFFHESWHDAEKPFLETAPWLIAIFKQAHGMAADGAKVRHYYATESVGIATGILVTALHNAGLASLTHTPSPMRFLNEILDRPKSERPFLLLVVGYPAEDARVPDISRKELEEFVTFM